MTKKSLPRKTNIFNGHVQITGRLLRASVLTALVCSHTMNAYSEVFRNEKVRLPKNATSVQVILDEIERQTNYLFVINSNVTTNRNVSLKSRETTVPEVLNEIFADTPVQFSIVENNILLSETAQNQQADQFLLKGTVRDAKGEGLIGVNVLIKGASQGTITDVDGKFSLEAKKGETLIISYTGYISKEIKVTDTAPVNIVLEEDNILLDAVVVTALGIKREAKSLTYNVQEVKSGELTNVRDASFVNSLAGKVAGVNINQSATGIGGSSRVIMRGTKSLFGNNDALYVVDGIPLPSLKTSQPEGIYGSPDGGDSEGISNINPDDIESISVLTGSAAAALYGSSGANGVVVITTKSGKEGRMKVNYSNSTQFMNPFVMPDFQNTYGASKGTYFSWGNKLSTPSSYDPKDFFQTGYNETNTVSVSGGTSRNQTYVSASAVNARGIIPNNTYNRYNFTMRNTAHLIKDKLTLDLGASYIIQDDKNMVAQGQYHNPLLPIYLFPAGDDINKFKVYERYNAERNFDTQYWTYGDQGFSMQNPYWIINRERFQNDRTRYMFNATLDYRILDWMKVTGRVRVDNNEATYTRKINASSSTLFASENGNYMNMNTIDKNTYADAIMNIDKRFDWLGVTANIGASITDTKHEQTGYEGHLLTVPNLFTFHNIDTSHPETKALQDNYHENAQAVFATVQMSYRSSLFLDLTARNDWVSTLAFTDNEKKGFFYPSVGLSAVVTEMADLSSAGISFLKVRGSYSEVGNAPMRFVTSTTYAINGGILETLPNVPATFLKPERTKSYEAGINMSLFNNKLRADVTYYNSDTYNQFFTFAMPPSTGYKNFFINGGKVNNWGIEASLNYKESIAGFTWSTTGTFTMNRNKIKELLKEGTVNPITGSPINTDELEVCNSGTYKMILKQGGTMSDIYVSTLKTDHHGNIKVDQQSGAIATDPNNWIKAGSAAPKCNIGWSNSFQYRGFELGLLIDARIGGVGVSATQALMDRFGVSQTSADARENGGVNVNGGMLNPEAYYSVVGGGTTGVLSQYVYSATNVRLREASLSYNFPAKWFNGTIEALRLSLTGRNLFMFYNKSPYDPEITVSTGTYFQGIDYFMQPSLRNIGFSVNVQF
ncbi:MAG: SusC/RagA family TonB-linked outer membrane protein [Bacteroidales bacterium]